jgi:hypothetical protein
MMKLIVIPIDGIHENEMYRTSVKSGVDLKDLQSLLFVKLYELLEEAHKGDEFRIWGVSSGIKSVDANKWNNLSENDFVFFTRNGSFVGFGEIETKFQSESIAKKIWPFLNAEDNRQYLLTFKSFQELDQPRAKNLENISKKSKLPLDSFGFIEGYARAEILKALEIDFASSIKAVTGQGFGLDAAERKIIEIHAVEAAVKYLRELGFTQIDDVGSTESFDLLATSGGKRLTVEVKGSTGPADTVILTRNEVEFQKSNFPANALFILSNIVLNRNFPATASGGDILFISPWLILESNLKPISFEYKV